PHGSTPHISASTTPSQDSLSISICSSHKHSTHSSDHHQSRPPKPTTKMPAPEDLPSDVVAVESGGVGYLFYVNHKNKLAYLKELRPKKPSSADPNTEFELCEILDGNRRPIEVHPDVKQLAAISWTNGDRREIRVYYANASDRALKETCLTNIGIDPYAPDALWKNGELNETAEKVLVPNSSISATIAREKNGWPSGIRLYASPTSGKNKHGVPPIAVYKYDFAKTDDEEAVWRDGDVINSVLRGF
ncbi:hypothetical protein V8F20_001420, partial [Naviculisporaceae sp. PSN 640]